MGSSRLECEADYSPYLQANVTRTGRDEPESLILFQLQFERYSRELCWPTKALHGCLK